MGAAVAAECAALQGRFEAFYNAVFDGQDSLGKRAWTSFAAEAGVRDSNAFKRCLHDSATMPLVTRDIAAGKELKVEGTPTVLINQWKMREPLTSASLERVVDGELNPRAPRPTLWSKLTSLKL